MYQCERLNLFMLCFDLYGELKAWRHRSGRVRLLPLLAQALVAGEAAMRFSKPKVSFLVFAKPRDFIFCVFAVEIG